MEYPAKRTFSIKRIREYARKAKKYAEGYLLKNLSSLNFSWPSGRRWSRPIPMKTPPENALAKPRTFVLVRQAFLLWNYLNIT